MPTEVAMKDDRYDYSRDKIDMHSVIKIFIVIAAYTAFLVLFT